MSKSYNPEAALDASPEAGERHQIIVKEFPDSQSGLLAEVYHYRENVNNCVQSASGIYMEDGYKKDIEEGFLDGHTKDVFVDNPENIYGLIRRTADGYWVEIGEGGGRDDPHRTILFARAYTEGDLNLSPLAIAEE